MHKCINQPIYQLISINLNKRNPHNRDANQDKNKDPNDIEMPTNIQQIHNNKYIFYSTYVVSKVNVVAPLINETSLIV